MNPRTVGRFYFQSSICIAVPVAPFSPLLPQVLYRDLDGTLTGHAGGWATPDSNLHPPQHCTKSVPEFSLNPSFPGTVCTSDVYFLRMAWNQATPLVWNWNLSME